MFDQTQIKQLIQAAEQAWYAYPQKQVWYAAVQTNKTSPIKTRKQKIYFLWYSFLIECLMAFKFYQTRSNSTKQGGQTVKCFVINTVWWCLVTKHFSFAQALNLLTTIMYRSHLYLRPEIEALLSSKTVVLNIFKKTIKTFQDLTNSIKSVELSGL